MENGHNTEVFSLMKGEWSCYKNGQFNGGRMVITEVAILMDGESYRGVSLMEGEWLLQRRPV